jgi:hypothetical protein
MSVYHRIGDISAMRSDALVRLAYRLHSYNGAVAARIAARRAEEQPGRPRRAGRVARAPRYERGSPMANNARVADEAPPATAGSLAALNAQLGAQWFSYRTAEGGGDG